MFKSLRYALRLLRKTPGFTLVSIFSLAIGIGATSAMFSFGDALLLRPLPVLEPTRIASVSTSSTDVFSNTDVLQIWSSKQDRTYLFDSEAFIYGPFSDVPPGPKSLQTVFATHPFLVSRSSILSRTYPTGHRSPLWLGQTGQKGIWQRTVYGALRVSRQEPRISRQGFRNGLA